MNTPSTPVYDSVRAAALEGVPSAAGRPPRHPDIYWQLCRDLYGRPASNDLGQMPRHHRADAFSARPARPTPALEQSTAQITGRRSAGAHALPWWQESLQLT